MGDLYEKVTSALIILMFIGAVAIPPAIVIPIFKNEEKWQDAYQKADYTYTLNGMFVLDGKSVNNASMYLIHWIEDAGGLYADLHIHLSTLAYAMSSFRFNSSLILDYVRILLYDDGTKIYDKEFGLSTEFIIDQQFFFNYASFDALIRIKAIKESIDTAALN